MNIQTLYPHIVVPENQPPHLMRHPRVRVAQIVMDYLAHGWSPEEICRQYSYLAPAEVHAAMAYYYDHREAIDSEIQSEVDDVAASRLIAPTSPFVARMKSEGRM